MRYISVHVRQASSTVMQNLVTPAPVYNKRFAQYFIATYITCKLLPVPFTVICDGHKCSFHSCSKYTTQGMFESPQPLLQMAA